ncbi:MAG: extracellular solute-binding protein [Nitrososphaerota archaeon]|nr:extracellular solute-binding protein [Nitrososphaerota archaeon]
MKIDQDAKEKNRFSRREALSTAMKVALGVVISGAAAGVTGYIVGSTMAPERVKTETRVITETVTVTAGTTPTTRVEEIPIPAPDAPIETRGLPYYVPQYPTKQEKEAIMHARRIMRERWPEKVTLRVLISPDNIPDFEPFYTEWKNETGISMETRTVPWPDWLKELMSIAVTKTDEYDILMLCPLWVPDLAEAGVLYPITNFVNKYKPEVVDPNSSNRILDPLQPYMKYKDDYYFFFSDTDIPTLYIRKDLLNDPEEKREFEKTYGYPLDKPKTLEEWRDQVKFFNRPEEGLYGMVMSWKDEALFDFLPRLVSQKVLPFDEEMRPNINRTEAVKAVEEMKEMLKYAEPGTLEYDFARSLEAFAQGRAYCTLLMTWAQAALEDPAFSKVVGKVTYAPHPGRIINGELVSPQVQYWGWGYAVSAYSKDKELAYLFCQWISGAAMNARVALTPGGWYDVCKVSNYDEKLFPEIRRKNGGIYADEWMEIQKWQVEHSFPALVLRGGTEYTGVLLEGLSAALKGALDSQAALNDVAKKWEEITERYGREGQIASWKSCLAMYSPPVKSWLGLP